MVTKSDNDEEWITNRVRKTEPKSDHSTWCRRCDAQLIREGEKCPNCGFRDKTKHAKP